MDEDTKSRCLEDGADRLGRPATQCSEPSRSGQKGAVVLAIGNFDGVHQGHQALLRAVIEQAKACGDCAMAMTFDPHPAAVLGTRRPALLTTTARKLELLRRIDQALLIDLRTFDRAFASLTPRAFVETILADHGLVRRIVVGENFRFGQGRRGDPRELAELGATLGYQVQSFTLAGDEGGVHSSTRVREALSEGDLETACAILTRPHSISGRVVRGYGRGRELGFPTANLEGVEELLPPPGVYAVLVDCIDDTGGGRLLGRGVMHWGHRPTVDADAAVEVHLLDGRPDLYGRHLRVHLVRRLRETRTFSGIDSLTRQMAKDVERASAVLEGSKPDPVAGGAWY